MGRKPAPQPLMLLDTNSSSLTHDDDPPTADTNTSHSHSHSPSVASHAGSKTPRSPRPSPFSATSTLQRSQTPSTVAQSFHEQDLEPPVLPVHDRDELSQKPFPSISSALEQPQPGSPSEVPPPRHAQPESKKLTKGGFFHFTKASKSSNHLNPSPQRAEHPPAGYREPEETGPTQPTTGLLLLGSAPVEHKLQKPPPTYPSRSDLSLSSSGEPDTSSLISARKTKTKTFGLLGRSKSIRDKERDKEKEKDKDKDKEREHSPKEPVAIMLASSTTDSHSASASLKSAPKTAPVAQDRTFREMMNSSARNRSEDRVPSREGSTHREGSASRELNHGNHREREHKPQPSMSRENGGSTFLSGLRNSSTRAADYISKGFFGKGSRSTNHLDKEPVVDDENYVLKVINLPLVEQTRMTRISKRLETSRDKTEFWMPAFAWRAIDYLNYKGCEVEGLYRVPGSGPQIKKWQRKFDEQYDVDLFQEDDLYDINIVGSMLKAWLRELPDELFPKDAQERIARECAGAEEVPKLLIEELSNLSPFRYYLLFAITCHLSLLLAHSDKNKMDFRNLCICFQPCMKIDAFCFKFLVCDWRECWQGCKTESHFIEEEYKLFEQPPPRGLSEPQQFLVQGEAQGQARQSPDPKRQGRSTNGDSKPTGKRKPAPLTPSRGNGDKSTMASISTNGGRERNGGTGDLRPLSPIKPLSPLGI
ncbi:hypothetical protein S40285_05698 [Stachybotrys chlorohalonatus IBT 40285]|uniref:Rho-GAP domain-containing protein n=1 Tax=Stachybotrys chlorohalonatus (strain IBT 40285) TaxID=1283841 RepID=A0A084QF22_STAC4|nr:hypothetical protein S40285_05698 [Stachybotrys chlorohalonata IBT 40285]